MKCGNCGNELPDSARFCNVCGAPQQPETVQSAPDAAFAPPALDETASAPAENPSASAEAAPVTAENAAAQQENVPAPADEAPAQRVDGAEVPVQPVDAPAADAAQPTLPEDPEQPIWNADVPQGYVVNPAYEMPPAPKKRNRKKILAITLSSVAVVLVAAALALYFLVFNTPTYRLMRAAKRTGELLQAQFVDCPNLKQAVQNVKTLDQKEELSVELNVESSEEKWSDEKVACRVDVSRAKREAAIMFSTESDDYSVDLTFADFDGTAYFTSDRMLSGDVYSLPLENLGKELKDSALAEAFGLDVDENLSIDIFTEASFAAYRASKPAAWTNFTDSLEIESLGKEDGDTRYRISADAGALQALVEDYLRYQSDAIYGKDVVDVKVDEPFKDDAEAELTVGVRDGLVHTLGLKLGDSELLLTMEQTDEGLHFVLSDEEDETSSLTVTLQKTDKGVTFTAEFVGDEFRIETDDNAILNTWSQILKRSETPTATLELAIEDGDGLLRVTRNGKVRELHYSTENDGLKLTMQTADGIDLELAVMPYDPIELDISEAESLIDMTSTQLQIFVMKIYTNLSR